MKTLFLITGLLLLMTSWKAHGHGHLSWPPSRSSCWRRGYEGCEPNYNDNQLNCGGFEKQWKQNAGRCGVCGAAYDDLESHQVAPQTAVLQGYRAADVIKVEVIITAEHGGWHEFRLCNLDRAGTLTHACLDQHLLQLADGSGSRRYGSGGTGSHVIHLQLPVGLRCQHCVLQWKWTTGNRWGCDNATRCGLGCGPQEQFYGCADISVQ